MIFRQIFDKTSYTYTYILGCQDRGEAILLDPVLDTSDEVLEVLSELGLRLGCTLETHIHADHFTGALRLAAITDCKIAGSSMDDISCRDIGVREGEVFSWGSIALHPLFTPGHTDTHHAYLFDAGMHKMVFTGDALMVDSCGRTDFQSGDAGVLYDSVHKKLFTLPHDTLVYPGHDYNQRLITTVGQEKIRNPRLGGGQTRDGFIAFMAQLNLPYPKMIDLAVPANRKCGKCPDEIPPGYRRLCEPFDQG